MKGTKLLYCWFDVVIVLFCFDAFASEASASYPMKETEPFVGSSIRSIIGSSSVPLGKTYDKLSPEQLLELRSNYANLPIADEPPYPADGLEELPSVMTRAHRKVAFGGGSVSMLVKVGADGSAQAIAVLESSSDNLRQLLGLLLLNARYKPAKCAGKPCDGEFKFTLTLRQ